MSPVTIGEARFVVHHGDNMDVLPTLADCSVDAIVTDPPAGIAFMGNKYAVRAFVCCGCGESVCKRARPTASYCSLSCYRSSQRPKRKTGRLCSCAMCGKELYRPKARNAVDAYCSVACHDQFQRRGRLTYSCKTCGVGFSWSPSRVTQANPTYCTVACRTACHDWMRNAVIAGNLKQQNNKAPTRLEIAGCALLARCGIAFSEQVLIAEKFVVDTVLLGTRIVVQWDGDYWHGYRCAGDCRPLDARQAKRIALDRSQDAYMRACGYTVLRFWEHEVFKQPEKVREAIQSAFRFIGIEQDAGHVELACHRIGLAARNGWQPGLELEAAA